MVQYCTPASKNRGDIGSLAAALDYSVVAVYSVVLFLDIKFWTKQRGGVVVLCREGLARFFCRNFMAEENEDRQRI